MKIGCNTVNFRTCTFDEALERIRRAGYEYVEIEANLSWCSHADPYKQDPTEFKEKVAGFGFKEISALGSHRELITDEQGARDIEYAISWAKKAQIPIVITGEGRKPPAMSETEALDILKRRLEKILQKAEEEKVHVAIEPHGSLSLSTGGLEKILSSVKSPWIAVNFDTANPHRGNYVGTTRRGFEWKLEGVSKSDEISVLRPIARFVKHVHIKDVVGRDAVALGKGEVNLRGCLSILKQAGYQGVLSYETEGNDSPDKTQEMIEESRTYLIDMLSKLD